MEKRLRRKFVLVAMCAVTVVLTLIVCAINVVNYVNVVHSADARLELIAQNGGSFPGAEDEDGSDAAATSESSAPADPSAGTVAPAAEVEATVDDDPGAHRDGGTEYERVEPPEDSAEKEAPFETRYFTVTVSSAGSVATSDVSHVAAVSQTDAESIAFQLADEGKTQGFFGSYRFCAKSLSNATLYVFVDCSHDLASFQSFLTASVLISLAGWALVLALVIVFSRVAIRPVVEAYDKQKRFITDASHEIKTPLAVIGAANEVQEIESGENEWTRSISSQVARLKTLTERLVFLARMDEDPSRLERTEVDISGLVESVAEPFSHVAESRGKTLACQIEPGLTCMGDVSALSQVVELLLDNATRYASEGSEISLALARHGRAGVRLAIENAVDALPEGDLSRLFERFYRADSSHNSQTGGSGVGLSVARAIVEAHGGNIEAAAAGELAIRFTVTL